MLFISSTPGLIRNLWQPKTAVFLHWCLIRAVPLRLPLLESIREIVARHFVNFIPVAKISKKIN